MRHRQCGWLGTHDRYIGGIELRVADYRIRGRWPTASSSPCPSRWTCGAWWTTIRSCSMAGHARLQRGAHHWPHAADCHPQHGVGLAVAHARAHPLHRLMKALGMPDAADGGVREARRAHSRAGLLWAMPSGSASRSCSCRRVDHPRCQSYYLSTVPIHLDLVRIAMVEAGILVARALAMFLPPGTSRLDPVESRGSTELPGIFAPDHVLS